MLATIRSRAAEGVPQPVQRLDPLIQKIVSEVSEERIAAILRKLESFETRNTLSDPNQTNRGIGVARHGRVSRMVGQPLSLTCLSIT